MTMLLGRYLSSLPLRLLLVESWMVPVNPLRLLRSRRLLWLLRFLLGIWAGIEGIEIPVFRRQRIGGNRRTMQPRHKMLRRGMVHSEFFSVCPCPVLACPPRKKSRLRPLRLRLCLSLSFRLSDVYRSRERAMPVLVRVSAALMIRGGAVNGAR